MLANPTEQSVRGLPRARMARWLLIGLATWTLVAAAGSLMAQESAPDARPYLRGMQEDAELADVCFIDLQRGWAVGDRGVIWHTADGGHHWHLQVSGVDCRLESVWFIDAMTGWAAGGSFQPYTHANSGVLLRTRDGGRTWLEDRTMLLPALREVQFFDAKSGVAVGETSPLFATGVFTTENGGRSWTPVHGLPAKGWLHADFVAPSLGIAVGHEGQVATVGRRGLQPVDLLLGLRNARAVKLAGPRLAWLVGDGGLIKASGDLGVSWHPPLSAVPPEFAEGFDWKTVATRDQQAWIAGSPGSRILYTPDAGRTWRALNTGQQSPLNKIQFLDDQHGWAVGALGTVLVTEDGGKTWINQRGGGTRAAVLAVYSEPSQVPLELLTRLSAQEGYLSRVQLLVRRDQEAALPHAATLPARAAAALVAVGTSGTEQAWQFPVRQPGLEQTGEQFVAGWDNANEGDGATALEELLVRQIRTWRPEVIITHAASPRGEDPLGHVINQFVLRAADKAQQPEEYPDHLAVGLPVWKVKKVIGSMTAGQLGDINLNTAQLAPRLGQSLADFATGPRGWMADQFQPVEPTLGFRVFRDSIPQGGGNRDFLSGIVLHPGSDSRRVLSESFPQTDLLRRTAQRHRNLQAILERPAKGQFDSARYLAQIGELTGGMDPQAGGELLFHLAQRYHVSGRGAMAAETLEVLVNSYPQHPLAPAALTWLVQYWSSSEMGWRMQRGQKVTTQEFAAMGNSPAEVTLAGGVVAVDNSAVRLATAESAAGAVAAAIESGEPNRLDQLSGSQVPLKQERGQRAAALGRLISRTFPQLSVEPRVQFPLAAVDRQLGRMEPVDKLYQATVRLQPASSWATYARGELWLSKPTNDDPPRRVTPVVRAAERPYLDGLFDDPVWQAARPLGLRSALREDADWHAEAQLAYDDEFLYVGVNCRWGGEPGAPARTARTRDANLAGHDRIELFLDLDRDGATAYRLAFDDRGFTHDSCWGDATWNPKWFVATARDAETWSVEAAIPLEELADQPPKPGTAWALGLQRTVPGVGFQSWSTPAATTIMPEGFGLMVFE